MIKNYLIIALRSFFKHKTFTFLNILGLSLGMVASLLILQYVKYERSYDTFHSKAKDIGMIGSRRRIKACFQRFRDEEKIAEEVIERVYAPIGLHIATETPAEIALSILAEVVKVRRGGKAASLSGH